MAYLNSDQYDKRRENAAKRMQENAQNEALTEDQHAAISFLCSTRHALHSNQRSAIIDDYQRLKKNIISANITILESGLEPMRFVSTDESDFIDIDDIALLEEIGENVPEHGTPEYNEWYDSQYYRISGELEELNTKIEKYISEIDAKYNTNYAPTGGLRIF